VKILHYDIYTNIRRYIPRRAIVVFLAAAVFCTLTMYYADITVTEQFGVVFLDSLFDKRFLSFYDNALASGIAPEGAVYDIGAYFIFGVWSLPVWILFRTLGISAVSVGALLWSKLLVIIFYAGTVYFVYRIGELLMNNSRKATECAFFYAISSSVFFPVFVAVQYDCISVFLLLWGVDSFFRDQKKWIWLVGLSMTIKPMTLLILLLLITYKEKNILRMIPWLFKGMLPLFICKAVYSQNSGYQMSVNAFLKKSMGGIGGKGIPTPIGNISIATCTFLVCLIIIYLYAFFSNARNNRVVIALCFAIWACYQAFGGMTCYWTIYLAPFMLLSVYMNHKRFFKWSFIFEFITELAMLIMYIIRYSWVYGGSKTYSYTVLKGIWLAVDEDKVSTLAGFFRRLGLETAMPAIIILDIIGLAMIFILSVIDIKYTQQPYKKGVKNSISIGQASQIIRLQYLLRLLIIYGFIAYTLMSLLFAFIL
jgi:hypothetical protein